MVTDISDLDGFENWFSRATLLPSVVDLMNLSRRGKSELTQ